MHTDIQECQRYFNKTYDTNTAAPTATGNGACSSVAIYSSGSQHLGTRWNTDMRVPPTVVIYPVGSTNSGKCTATSNNAEITASGGDIGTSVFQYLSGALPTGDNGVRWQYTTDADL